MTHMSYDEVESPIGPLVLGSAGNGLCQIEFGPFTETVAKLQKWSQRWYGTDVWVKDESAFVEISGQFKQYFEGKRTVFDIKMDLKGTPFQVKVWQALNQIPYGTVCSYKDIGQAIESAKAVRAVGGANNRNPIPIIIPCHRVIGANGTLVGYGGGLHIKTYLLQLEGYATSPNGNDTSLKERTQ
jgi:methylated-DNA-[protein]-cysteine S-methyltransferase